MTICKSLISETVDCDITVMPSCGYEVLWTCGSLLTMHTAGLGKLRGRKCWSLVQVEQELLPLEAGEKAL